MLLIVCGLQGTGKTTVAKKIADRTNSVLLRSDIIRKEMFEHPTYSEEEKQDVYTEMTDRARTLLSDGLNVVLDATFNTGLNRDQAEQIAIDLNIPCKIIKVECDEDVIEKRISERIGDASNANFNHYLQYKQNFEEFVEPPLVIDNSGMLPIWTKRLRI
ncbi:MAG: AAA family ATPase [Patescibacteria group bacterium]